MTTPTILPPPLEVLAACDEVDGAIAAFLRARGLLKDYGQYESSSEALLLFNLVVRHIEGVLALARTDLALLPAAMACARAAIEVGIKAAWMVDANDPFIRETRWLAHLEEEERVYERTAKRWANTAHDSPKFLEGAAQLRELRKQITAKLPPQIQPLKHSPTADQMFASLDGEELYPLYIYLSQFVHGGHAATTLYRRGIGTMRKPGEFISAADWYLPIRISWLALSEAGSLVLSRLGSQGRRFITATEIRRIEARLSKVRDLGGDA